MTRSVSSVFTDNKSVKSVVLASMAALFAVTAFCFDASAKGDPLSVQDRNHVINTGLINLDATAEQLKLVPGLWNNTQQARVMENRADRQVAKSKKPSNVAPQAQATQQAQSNQAGNNAGDIAREQAIQAIDYCQRVMKNFTTEGGNRWNRLRDSFFVPMALLLILPGAVLTQVRAIIAQGNPLMAGQASPLEGIQRAIIGIFLVPSTYLVVNYSIDLGNSLQYTIASEYRRIQGTDMYQDAMCAEIRAFGVRYLSENEGSMANLPQADTSPRGSEPFAKAEGMIWGKLVDPCVGLNLVPANRDDNTMPQGSLGMRMAMNMTNAGINTAWSILTAFQMAFMYYLFFVGPIMAALWTWPMKIFRDAFPAWCEGVITLAFWSFFWNVVILIIALTKSEASSGLYIVTACNFLATAAVRYAFDFAGMMRGAAMQAERLGAQAAKQAQGGGKGGKGGQSGKSGKSNNQNNTTPNATPSTPAIAPDETPTRVAARTPLLPKPQVASAEFDENGVRKPSKAPAILTVPNKPIRVASVDPALVPLPPQEVASTGRLLGVQGFEGLEGIDPNVISQYRHASIRTFNPVTGEWMAPESATKMPPMTGNQTVVT
jgi:hypothetical protein